MPMGHLGESYMYQRPRRIHEADNTSMIPLDWDAGFLAERRRVNRVSPQGTSSGESKHDLWGFTGIVYTGIRRPRGN